MDMNSLAHTKWNCKYHIVFAPKYRRKIIYGQLKRDLGNFHFKEGGQNYHSVGEVDEIQVIIQDSGSVKAPEYSHTANRSYAIVQNGKLKHITFYDDTAKCYMEVQLRTKAMDDNAEIGPANHLGYEKRQENERARRDVIPV